MKPKLKLGLMAVVVMVALAWAGSARASTTIDPVNRYAYGANLGWMNWYADGVNGAVVTDYVLSGFIYAANVGWINLGSGSPVNGIRYQNLAANDFGVNNDGLGNLRGYAWSANVGWISLSTAFTSLQTDHILPGPLDVNGLPIPWELANFGMTGVNPNADPDHDGQSNLQEYLAGTDPNNGSDYLHITAETFGPEGTTATITWASVLTRCYYIKETTSLDPVAIWSDSGLGIIVPAGSSTVKSFVDLGGSAPIRFYRVEAVRPLP